MKIRFLLKIVEKILGTRYNSDEPRADMYLPDRLLGMSLIFLACGIVCAILTFTANIRWIIGAVILIPLGIAAFLCWKNQSIHIISDEQFTYTTMFGNSYTYYFSDIRELRLNKDSYTLLVADKKVHIESMAILSRRLIDHVDSALDKVYKH